MIRLDAALLDLRRLTAVPAPDSTIRHGTERVEVSTVLVVDAVARAARAGKLCSIGDVAAALHVAHSTASRLVDRAVKAAMLCRDRSTDDPRRSILRLTPEGQRLQQDAVRFRTDRLAALTGGWSNDDVTTFIRLLERFAAAAQLSLEESS